MKIKLPEPISELIGHIEPGAITNFYGAPGTGKTNLCLLAALECIKNNGVVTYIDTEGGFSVERLRQITPNYKSVLKCITIIEPKDFREQGVAIRSLPKTETDMIILDSAVALYRIEYSDTLELGLRRSNEISKMVLEANRELSKQLSILSNISREKKIPVLITSHMFHNWNTGEIEIVGGENIKYWSKIIVYLEKTGKSSERKATIIKHRFLPEGKSVKFMIVNEGIKPSGFRLF